MDPCCALALMCASGVRVLEAWSSVCDADRGLSALPVLVVTSMDSWAAALQITDLGAVTTVSLLLMLR